jgi:chromosome segregation ATPase
MEIKDISENGKGLYGLENQEKPWNTSDNLEEIGKEKIESLKEEVKEVEELIKNREKLSKEVFQEAEKVKIEINNFLAETNPTDLEGHRDKVTLKQKQVEISELQLKEKISCWQDIAKLKQELRECKKELAGREGRLDMLGKILED